MPIQTATPPPPEPGWDTARPPLSELCDASHDVEAALSDLLDADSRPASVLAAMELAARARALAALADGYVIAVVTTPRTEAVEDGTAWAEVQS